MNYATINPCWHFYISESGIRHIKEQEGEGPEFKQPESVTYIYQAFLTKTSDIPGVASIKSCNIARRSPIRTESDYAELLRGVADALQRTE